MEKHETKKHEQRESEAKNSLYVGNISLQIVSLSIDSARYLLALIISFSIEHIDCLGGVACGFFCPYVSYQLVLVCVHIRAHACSNQSYWTQAPAPTNHTNAESQLKQVQREPFANFKAIHEAHFLS